MPLPIIKKANDAISGAPEQYIMIGLFVVAAVAILVAMFAPPIAKAAVLAWMVAP